MTGDTDFTPEEQAAMDAMQADDRPEPTDDEIAQSKHEKIQEKAEPEPASEPEPQPEPQPDPNKPPEGYVPHSAMHQERERRKQAEQEREELRQRIAALEAANAPKQAEPAEVPDPIIDPDGFRDYMRKLNEAQAERWQQQEQQARAQQRLSQAASLEQQFAAATPDYTQAVQHLHQNRVAELTAYGYGQEQIGQILANDANAIFDNAMAQGKNPAEVLYQAAKMRGWSPETAAPDPAAATARVEAKAAAQANTGSLATAGGPSTAGQYTMEMLARMPEDELAKLPKEVVRKVMGG